MAKRVGVANWWGHLYVCETRGQSALRIRGPGDQKQAVMNYTVN